MTLGERIEARRKALGIKSQSELARRVPMNQSTLSGLIRNPYRWSPYLPGIARELQTTVEYLVGEALDPDENAPPPPPAPVVQYVMMPVALPCEAALAQMFEALLLSMPGLAGAELARELATLLPTALGSVRGALLEIPPDRSVAPPALPEADDAARPARQRASRK